MAAFWALLVWRGRFIVEHLRGRGDVEMSTEEIMALTRGES